MPGRSEPPHRRETAILRLQQRPVRFARLAMASCALAGVALTFGACSSQMSRRDEYYLIRELTFKPQAGDGSTIVVGREQELLQAVAGADSVPMRGIDADR